MDWLNKCHFGDCREVMKDWPAAAADACITDPPYGDTSLDWDKQVDGWIRAVSRVLKPAASIWVFGSMRFLAPLFSDMENEGFRYSQDIVWEKQNGTGFHADRFRRVHEHAVMFYRGAWSDVHHATQYTQDATAKTVRRKTRPTHTGHIDTGHYVSLDGGPRLMRSVMAEDNEHGKAIHPTQKPLAIIAPLIRYSVPENGLVLDPFYGSGSTGITARALNRNFAACENDRRAMQMQDERLRQPSLNLEAA
jgi:site-specific DNA-methyltransferase (adenine-specific)